MIRLFQTRFDSIHLQKIAIQFDFPCKKNFNVQVRKSLVNYNIKLIYKPNTIVNNHRHLHRYYIFTCLLEVATVQIPYNQTLSITRLKPLRSCYELQISRYNLLDANRKPT